MAVFTPDKDDVEIEEVRPPVTTDKKIAYCYNPTNATLAISNSGHGTILRGRDKRDYSSGGWVDIASGRIWETNGTVKNVPKPLRDVIAQVFSERFDVTLRWPHAD